VRQQSAMFCQIILLIIALEEWDESMRASAGERARANRINQYRPIARMIMASNN
jgi:hypothetical protein